MVRRPAVPWLLAAAVFAPVYNFLLFSVENLLFLVFPTRIVATTPADLQAMGRNVLSQFAKLVGMGGAGVVAAVAGVVVYFLTGSNMWAAATAAWLAAAVCAAALVPLMGLAFQAYDVSRDAALIARSLFSRDPAGERGENTQSWKTIRQRRRHGFTGATAAKNLSTPTKLAAPYSPRRNR